MYGEWQTTPQEYVDKARRLRDAGAKLGWCAVQDWMCEPFILAKTGKTLADHQRLTIESYFTLRDLEPSLNWVPVLQGWRYDDYFAHAEQYAAAGVQLRKLMLVGVGSICRRQHTTEAEEIIRDLAGAGLKLHGFGFKLQGLIRCSRWLASADSMAWSFQARRSPPLPGHTHKSCANCMTYALQWREKVLNSITRGELRIVENELWS
jgi:hypothetical protein